MLPDAALDAKMSVFSALLQPNMLADGFFCLLLTRVVSVQLWHDVAASMSHISSLIPIRLHKSVLFGKLGYSRVTCYLSHVHSSL